jgi:hypothetical protein
VAVERPRARTPKPRSIRSCATPKKPATRRTTQTRLAESARVTVRRGLGFPFRTPGNRDDIVHLMRATPLDPSQGTPTGSAPR